MSRIIAYISPVVFYLLVSMLGSRFTSQGIPVWYGALEKPSFTPPGFVIGIIWTIIYILAAVSMALFITAAKEKRFFWHIFLLYILNGAINAAWSWIFFSKHMLGLAVLDSALIGITVLLIMIFVWSYSKISSLLLLPYLLWVSFATYLSYLFYRLNL
ncbi:MAG: tryptophan-rich sensory protein [Nitrospiraceae bacterium]|nr:tryptophan-rich sensory protein [Nitrospiraceae bacterium]